MIGIDDRSNIIFAYQNMPDFVSKACDCSAPITLEPCRADYQKAESGSGWLRLTS